MAKRKTVKAPVNDDRAFILNPNRGPMWPWCPLKRKNLALEDKNLGVLYHSAVWSDGKVHVIHCYMYDPPKSRVELHAAPRTSYDSVDEMLADGWVVD